MLTSPTPSRTAGGSPENAANALATLRRWLLALFAISVLGTGVELLLLGHFETAWQWTPLVLFAVCLLVVGWQVIRPSRASLLALRVVTGLCVAAGALGLFLHYRGNAEFEKEMYPSIAGWDLFREAMTGATPALAPGTMFLLGFLGLLSTFRHPLLNSRRAPAAGQRGDDS